MKAAAFHTRGCAVAIASGSCLAEWVTGPPVEEALAITQSDAARWVASVPNRASGGGVLSSFVYPFDDADNPIQVTEHSGDVSAWNYDAAGQLTNERRTGDHA